MKTLHPLLESEHQKHMKQLQQEIEFLRTEADERKALVSAILDSGPHMMKVIEPLHKAVLDLREEMHRLNNDLYKSRVFVDNPFMLSANVGYEVNYLERKYLFVWTAVSTTLAPSGGGPGISVTGNLWTSLSAPRGTILKAPSFPDSAPALFVFRATDNTIDDFVTLDAGSQTIGNVGSISDYPVGAVPINAESGNVANAVATATLAASLTQKTWITGFQVTGSGATAGLPVQVTVTGLVGGTQTFIYCAAVGVLIENTPLIVTFPKPVPSSAINTAIVVSCPALGSGNTNNTVNAQGYQL